MSNPENRSKPRSAGRRLLPWLAATALVAAPLASLAQDTTPPSTPPAGTAAAGNTPAAGNAPAAGAESVPFPHAPVPNAERSQIPEAARKLKQRLEQAGGGNAGGTKMMCFLEKLAAGGDDRILEWTRICPAITGGADSDICTFTAVGEEALADKIRQVSDVETANGELHFMSYLGAYALRLDRNFQQEDDDARVSNELERIAAEIDVAKEELSRISNDTTDGPPPLYYKALHEWLVRKQGDANSVYACMTSG